jgi:hypothetical protein
VFSVIASNCHYSPWLLHSRVDAFFSRFVKKKKFIVKKCKVGMSLVTEFSELQRALPTKRLPVLDVCRATNGAHIEIHKKLCEVQCCVISYFFVI